MNVLDVRKRCAAMTADELACQKEVGHEPPHLGFQSDGFDQPIGWVSTVMGGPSTSQYLCIEKAWGLQCCLLKEHQGLHKHLTSTKVVFWYRDNANMPDTDAAFVAKVKLLEISSVGRYVL